MRTQTRPDGSTYIETTRSIYIAVGSTSPEILPNADSALREFDSRLRSGAAPHIAAQVFPHDLQRIAAHAATCIRRFEALVGEETGAEVISVRTPDDPNAVALQNRNAQTFGSSASDLADLTARALAELLAVLGYRSVVSSNID